jgi:PadR family transcriptional regulator, regulatory protein PadR
MTLQTQLVLRVLLRNARGEHYGLEIAKAAGLPTGTIYPILTRLEVAAWVESDWETIDESAEGRRKRRYYRLTSIGAARARDVLTRTKHLMFPELSEMLV